MFKALSNLRTSASVALIIILLSACEKKETSAPLDFKFNYYPLEAGRVNIYEVDSIHYSGFNNSQTQYNFELKDSVVNDISEGDRKTVIIHRFKKPENGNWTFQKVITRTITGQRAEEFIDNVRFVRLVFPPEAGKYWKGNTYNTLSDYAVFSITDVDKKLEVNSLVLDSTLTVEEEQENNLIRQYYSTAIYAKNIGLVQRSEVNGETEITETEIKDGYRYTMTLKSYK
ncbi:hypothetical protein [Desertivirga xinjiangensis]|uniref:hypothetical protein n=1 Tax=Desertivirga xinjiangensis TaxID=539206 RepID=UPI002109871F|nr:hypothetical protein [Pedobacter xinjiangensis]